MCSGSGGVVLMRFFFGGADTPSDSSRGGRYPTLLGDVKVAAVAGIQPLP